MLPILVVLDCVIYTVVFIRGLYVCTLCYGVCRINAVTVQTSYEFCISRFPFSVSL